MQNMIKQLMENTTQNRDENKARKQAARVRIMAAMVNRIGLDQLEADNVDLTAMLPVKLSNREVR